MRTRKRKFKETSTVDFLLLRENLGLGRYRKQRKRDKEERQILLDLALKKIEKKEENDFLPLEKKKRKIRI